MNRRYAMLGVVAVLALALLAAACGGTAASGGGMYGSPAPSTPSAATPTSKAAAVAVGTTKLGPVVVNSAGRTLYLFEKDKSPKSTCSGECANDWPPLMASGKPAADTGVKASMLGTTKRSDGKEQVTYNGHPLYTFTGDQNPGDTSGQGVNAFGACWYVVSTAGNQVTAKPSGSGGGGGGVGY